MHYRREKRNPARVCAGGYRHHVCLFIVYQKIQREDKSDQNVASEDCRCDEIEEFHRCVGTDKEARSDYPHLCPPALLNRFHRFRIVGVLPKTPPLLSLERRSVKRSE